MDQKPNKVKWYKKIQANLKEGALARKVKANKRQAKLERRKGLRPAKVEVTKTEVPE